MDFRHINVLLADGRDRQTLPMAKAFKKLGCHVTTLNMSRLDNGYTSRYPDEKLLNPAICNSTDALQKTLDDLIQTGNYHLVVPTSDVTAELLANNKQKWEQHAKLAIVDQSLFEQAYDKNNTLKCCMEHGIPCPQTYFGITSLQQLRDLPLRYPIVIKPRKSFGAIGFHKFDSYEQVALAFEQSGESLSHYVVQEYIPQTGLQYEAAMFVDNNNDIKTALVFSKNRWFPVEGGSSTLNITVSKPQIVQDCSRLLKLLEWRGAADVDLIADPRDGTAKILEINPRVSGSVKITFAAGVNIARQMLELAFGKEVTPYLQYRTGVRLRCLHTDVLWFVKSPDRFRAKPSWFSFRNTYDQTFSWDDPLPFFTYSIQSLLRVKGEMKKRTG